MPNGQNQAMPLPRARLGRWSIVLAVVALLLLAAGAAGLVMAGFDQHAGAPTVAMLTSEAALWLSLLFNLIGVVLGVIGLVRQGPDRYFGAAGLIINVLMVFGSSWLAGQFILLFAG